MRSPWIKTFTKLTLSIGLTAIATQASALTIKIGHFGNPNTPFDDGVKIFAQKVDQLSHGDIKVVDFPSGQLGNESQEIAALRGGLQEMLITSSSNLTRYSKPLQVLDLPFLFANDEQTDKVLLGPTGDKLLTGLNGSGLKGLTFWDNGFRDLSNSKHPITKLSDFKGLSFRVIGQPVYIDTFKALGANPVPMPFPEVYSALETKTVSGQDNPLLTVRDVKFYEVQKYLTHSRHAYSAMIVLAGKPFWSRLTDAQKEIVQKAAREAGIEQRKIMRDAVEKAENMLKKHMEVADDFAPGERAKIAKAVQPVINKMLTDETRPFYKEIKADLAK
ncbi:DctP family TRAP transporter solute-binding subunit [Vibrio sp. CAIM 722]|uniref:DctP family TRAP transporter solute-binding subunit n=1 Tax=Vibrio eleionomae TaxID=2653505 RepID=A0A7X4LNY2_9VIBR|nr:DctP family TRAP transporter solute-binding subunit [Vibrio eleionomae]MZI94981.1 DctP family TRAP transporter solute-binding subunit [Vibrio eleionomae]